MMNKPQGKSKPQGFSNYDHFKNVKDHLVLIKRSKTWEFSNKCGFMVRGDKKVINEHYKAHYKDIKSEYLLLDDYSAQCKQSNSKSFKKHPSIGLKEIASHHSN